MLDFYLIKENQPSPLSPEKDKVEYLAGLDSKSFANLSLKGIIVAKFDYYSDFRWNTSLIKQYHLKILNCNKLDTDIESLKLMLEKAIKLKREIIAFCD